MKVFIAVGTLFPFDRLVEEVDRWAAEQDDVKVIGQIGAGRYQPVHIESHQMLAAGEFNRIFNESDLVITHAGMGTILKSLVAQKPIVVMPRKLELKEAVTDHQMATAKVLEKMGYVHVAWNNEELAEYLKNAGNIGAKSSLGEYASGMLVDTIRKFIRDN